MSNMKRKVLNVMTNFQDVIEKDSKKLEDITDKIAELFVDSVTDSLDKLSDYETLNSKFIQGLDPYLSINVTEHYKILSIEGRIYKNKDELTTLLKDPIKSFRAFSNKINEKLGKIAQENNLQSLTFKRPSLAELGYRVSIRLADDQYFKYKKLLEEV